jgi:hypothetical protein
VASPKAKPPKVSVLSHNSKDCSKHKWQAKPQSANKNKSQQRSAPALKQHNGWQPAAVAGKQSSKQAERLQQDNVA